MRPLRTMLVALGAALGVGCSLLLDTAEAVQCRSDADCDLTPSLRGRICTSGLCVKRIEPIAGGDAGGCVSTDLCTQATSNRASVCRAAGAPCLQLEDDDLCPLIRGDWKNPDAVFVGILAPLTFLQADQNRLAVPYVGRVLDAIELAHDELDRASGGGLRVGDRLRPVVMLACDTRADPAATLAAYDHLVGAVGAQALVVVSDRDLAEIAKARPSAAALAVACSDCLVPIPSGVPAFRHMPLLAYQAPVVARRVRDIETQLRASAPADFEMRVAVLREDSLPGDAFYSALVTTLRFNDKTAAENGSRFVDVKSADPKVGFVHSTYAKAIVDAAPDVIVVAVGSDFGLKYLGLIEQQWPSGKPRPRYLLTDLNYEVAPHRLVLAGPDKVDLRRRISGTHPFVTESRRQNRRSFDVLHSSLHGQKPTDSNWSGFEAMTTISLAMVRAAHAGALDGPAIASEIPKLAVAGAPVVRYGFDQLDLAITTAREQPAGVNVQGMWTDLDWSATTRDLPPAVGTYCFGLAGSEVVLHDDAGLSAIGDVFSGSYACPSGE